MKHGPENEGNQCYLNSVLTSLAFCPFFVNHYLLCPPDPPDAWSRAILSAWREGGDSRAQMSKLKATFPAESVLSSHDQEDAHEAFLAIMETMDERIRKQIFSGEETVLMECKSCGHRETRREQFHALSMHVNGPGDVEALLQGMAQEEAVPDYRCDGCGLCGDVRRMVGVSRWPACMCLHIARFARGKKVHAPVAYGPTLGKMKLFAVVRHSGSLNKGHYTATVRHHENWYHVNDEHVSPAAAAPRADGTEYMLFFA